MSLIGESEENLKADCRVYAQENHYTEISDVVVEIVRHEKREKGD